MMTTIECKDLVKDIKGVRVIDKINLTMSSGKITGFKGINSLRH